MNKEVKQLMNELASAQHVVNPRAEWVKQTRARLLAHIERTTEQPNGRIFTLNHLWSALTLIIPQKAVYAYVRPFVIFAICFGLGTAGWITTVSASLNSLPGDALYPVKIATEQTQVAVVDALQGSAASTELHLAFASRRAEEVNKIIETPNVDPVIKQRKVQEAVKNFKTEVRNVSEKLGATQQASPEIAAAVVKVVERKTDEIKTTLEAAVGEQSNIQETVAAIDQLKSEVVKAKEAAKEAAMATTTNTTTNQTVTNSIGAADIKIVTTTLAISPTSTISIAPFASTATQTTQPATSTIAPVAPVSKIPATIPNVPIANPEDFPERPKELNPDVTDKITPIHLEILVIQ